MPIAENVILGNDVVIPCRELVNLYGCIIGANVFIGPFTEIQKNVFVDEFTRIQSHTFICEGVSIGKRVFVGHGVMFINDRAPVINNKHWILEKTIIEDDVSIGTGAVIMCGITIGRNSLIGAGAVVTKNISPRTTVKGVPAK